MDFITRDLAEKLAKNWVQGYTLSGRTAFIANEKEREAILAVAKSLGIGSSVYSVASEIIKGGK